MNRRFVALIGLFGIAACASSSVLLDKGPGSGTVRVRVTGFEPVAGQMRIALFATPDGFPTNPDKAERVQSITVTGDSMDWILEDVATGMWAIVVLHDEDEDGKMKRDWLGRPREGWGVSKDADAGHRPPSFDDCAVAVARNDTEVRIRVRY